MAYHADLESRIAELSGDQIVGALRKHLVPERLIVVLAGDFEKDSPDKTD
jgi:predicted Zn-dependent peptidase